MKRDYWERHANNFEEQIFSVYNNDRGGRIVGKLRKYGSKTKTATDMGCGIGDFLPDLSRCFKSVMAVDISSKCLARAKQSCTHLKNVSYKRADLTRPGLRLPKVDLALSVNSVLMPSIKGRRQMLQNIFRHIARGGHLVLAVPSVESAMLTQSMLVEWNVRIGISPAQAAVARFGPAPSARQLRDGIFIVDGIPTKHFLKEEFEHVLASHNMNLLETEKIEYPWTTEYDDPPSWMQAPCPWDWLMVAKRN